MAKKIKEEQLYDPCPLIDKFESREKGLFKLNGMCWILDNFPKFRKICESCQFFHDLPPVSYTCKRFYCTMDRYKKEDE